ncbi:MAG: BTAD domain-containing putative transcriptional regulator [Acidimicrobiales bacterium]
MANHPASTSFDLLGPLVVTVAGSAVRLGGPRQVAVLARLLLAPGQVVSMEQLAESVWDGDLPARPEVAIRSYISNLRRSIEPARHPGDRQSCIESIAPGYRLAVDPGAIDAHRFEQLVAQGRSALGRGEPGLAGSHLASALRLWRGEPCEGLVDTDALMAYRSRLAELRLVATEQWFEARLALGEHEALAPDLEAVLAEHPQRERLTELAMLALYRAGRQSEALAACQRLRSLLVEQLGIDPGPRVQALEHKILTHDPSLLTAGVSAPVPAAVAPAAEHPTVPAPDGASPDGPGPAAAPDGGLPPTSPPLDRAGAPPSGDGDGAAAMASDGGPLLDDDNDDAGAAVGEGRGAPVPGPAVAAGVAVTGDAGGPSPGEGGPGGDGVPDPGIDLVLGRTRELAVLAGLEVALDQGRSATVVITGEPGSGKSALLGKVADRGASAGAAVAWGRCREVAQSQVLWPWSQILQHLAALDSAVTGTDDPDAPAGPDHALSELVRAGLVAGPADGGGPDGRSPAPPRDPGEATALFPAIVRYLRQLAARRPILVVIDDAQWADEASVELLAFAGPALSADRVAFAVAWRHTEAGPSSARRALRDLTRLPGMHRIELDGLPVEAVADLAAALRPDLPEPSVLASALRQATAGNPFLVRQMLQSVVEWAAPGPWPPGPDDVLASVLGPAPPTTVQEQIALRAERAHPSALAVLTVAALSRTPLTAEVVAEAVELPLAEVEDALEQAVQAGLLADSPQERTYRFVHPVAARALTAALTGPRLARLHAALAHALWRAGGPPIELVHHFARARSVGTSLLAARFALLALRESTSFELLAEAEALVAPSLEVVCGLEGAEVLGAELALFEAQVARLRGETDRRRRAATLARSLARRAGGPDAEALALLAGTGPHPWGPAFSAVAWSGSPDDAADAAADISLGEGGDADTDAQDGGWWAVLATRRARLDGRAAAPELPRPGSGDDHGAGRPELAAAAWRERALAALETGSDEDLAVLATGPAPVSGAGSASSAEHDRLLARRLTVVAGLDGPGPVPTPGPVADQDQDAAEQPPAPATPARSQGPPRSVLDLDRTLTALGAGLARGRLDGPAAELIDRLALWGVRSGIAPGAIRWLRCQALWEWGGSEALEAEAAGSAGAGELLVWLAVAAAEDGHPARAGALLDRALDLDPLAGGPPGPVGRALGPPGSGLAGDVDIELEMPLDLRPPGATGPGPERPDLSPRAPGRWGRAERCLLLLAAARAGHGPAIDHFGRRLDPGPAVVSSVAGLAVLGPVDWFRGVGALAAGDPGTAAALFDRADGIARRHGALTWQIRAQIGLAEAAATTGDGEGRRRHEAAASALAATAPATVGWLDRWAVGPGTSLVPPPALTGPTGAAGLQSTSNRFATR